MKNELIKDIDTLKQSVADLNKSLEIFRLKELVGEGEDEEPEEDLEDEDAY